MKKSAFFVLLVLLAVGAAAQSNLKPRFGLTKTQIEHIDTLLAHMAKSNYASMQWGIWERDNQWDGATPMQILNRMLTAYELYDLALHHTSPAVRVTAGSILVERYTQLAPQVVMDLLADSGMFHFARGCFGYFDYVGSWVLNKSVENKTMPDSLLHIVDSLILLPGYRHIERRCDLVRRLPLTDENHDLLLRLWKEEGQRDALGRIAAFRREADTSVIIEALHDNSRKRVIRKPFYHNSPMDQALEAIVLWPHEAFKPHLEAMADKYMRNSDFYETVLAFDTAWAVTLIDSMFARLARNPENKVESYAPQGQLSMWAGEALYRAYKRRPNEALRRRLSQYMVIPQY